MKKEQESLEQSQSDLINYEFDPSETVDGMDETSSSVEDVEAT